MAAWIMYYGVPEVFVIDQGGEFEAEFIAMCEESHIDTKVAGSHAHWQHGFAERHGCVLGKIFENIVYQFSITGKDEVKLALAISRQAKHAVLTRNGMHRSKAYSAGACAGPSLAQTTTKIPPLAALGADGETWKTSHSRAAAKLALLSREAPEKIRRAMIRRAPAALGKLTAGMSVYFYSPHPMKGRRRADPIVGEARQL